MDRGSKMDEIKLVEPTAEYADDLWEFRQEIIEVIKKYIDVDESAIDVRMTNRTNDDGTNGAPALYANIPILSIKDDVLREKKKEPEKKEEKQEEVEKENNTEQPKKEEEVKEEKIEQADEEQNEDETKEEDEPKTEESDNETASNELI